MIKLNLTSKLKDKKKYKIFLALKKNSNEIKKFINTYWKKNHALVRSPKLFNFQHLGTRRLNWILAKNNITGKLEGILGLISKNFYSKGYITKSDDINIAIIMVASQLKPSKGLGTEMIIYFNKLLKPSSISAIGINEKVSKLYEKFGFKKFIISQYYLKNDKKFSIKNSLENIQFEKNYNKLSKFKYFDQRNKDANYFIKRYFKHPIYKYDLLIIQKNSIIDNFLILRKIKYKKKFIFRIVDIGSIKRLNRFSKANLLFMLKKENVDYIDFLNFGISEKKIKKIGMRKRDKQTLIPHLFEPLINKNYDVLFAYKSKYKNFYVFKGDSDLDRPSVIKR